MINKRIAWHRRETNIIRRGALGIEGIVVETSGMILEKKEVTYMNIRIQKYVVMLFIIALKL